MGKSRIRFVVPPEWRAWRQGFGDMEKQAIKYGFVLWQAATEVFFDRTQEAVHILSGDLKRSGEMSVRPYGRTIVGEVTYGNEEVDYAPYEIARGGSHDFMTIGWSRAEQVFDSALPNVWENIVRGWRR